MTNLNESDHINHKIRRNDEIFNEEDEAEYIAATERVALKVKRQQDGSECAILSNEHYDEKFHLIEDIQCVIERQRELVKLSKFHQKFASAFTREQRTLSNDELTQIGDWYIECSKYIPLRLEYEERAHLRRVQAVMKASNYTGLIDGVEHKTKQVRIHRQGAAIRAVFMGIAASFNYSLAQECIENFNFKLFKKTYTKIFEIARRYKIMNPEKMRDVYGKMIYLLQDAMANRAELEFDLVRPLETVHSTLSEAGGLDLLRDHLISTATMEILHEGKSRSQIQNEISLKECAISYLAKTYSNKPEVKLKADTIKRCLYSLADNTSFLNSNCKPIEFVIKLLRSYFGPPETSKTVYSLAIYGGIDGSRLTHSHKRQYHYVLQSLTLWREIVNDMFRLWYLAEQDLLDPNEPYKLRNTGQGYNRLQQAPRTQQAIHGILFAVQQKLGNIEGWVGSSVIHLGDNNVPNALLFIDKYLSVPRILNPVVRCIKYIQNDLEKDQGLMELVVSKFGSKVRFCFLFLKIQL